MRSFESDLGRLRSAGLQRLSLALLAVLQLAIASGQGQWRQLESLPQPTGELIAVHGMDEPTVVGGLRGAWQVVDELWQYRGEDEGWEALPPMPVALNHHAAAAVDGMVYVMGGSAQFDPQVVPRVEVYAFDPESGEWQERAPMPSPRLGHAAASLGGLIYVVGGVNSGDEAALIYDPESDTWELGPALSSVRDHLGLVALDGRLYALGGRTNGENRADVEVLDTQSGEWTSFASMHAPRSGFAVAVVAGRIHVAGGESLSGGGRVLDSHEIYDATAGAWTQAEPMPQPSHGVAGFGFEGGFMVVGGSSLPGGRSLEGWLKEAWLFE